MQHDSHGFVFEQKKWSVVPWHIVLKKETFLLMKSFSALFLKIIPFWHEKDNTFVIEEVRFLI